MLLILQSAAFAALGIAAVFVSSPASAQQTPTLPDFKTTVRYEACVRSGSSPASCDSYARETESSREADRIVLQASCERKGRPRGQCEDEVAASYALEARQEAAVAAELAAKEGFQAPQAPARIPSVLSAADQAVLEASCARKGGSRRACAEQVAREVANAGMTLETSSAAADAAVAEARAAREQRQQENAASQAAMFQGMMQMGQFNQQMTTNRAVQQAAAAQQRAATPASGGMMSSTPSSAGASRGACPYHEAEACSRWYNGH